MSNLKNILRDVGYFSVGAAAVLLEVGSKAAKALVRKGEKTLRDNQDTVDDLKRKAKDLGEKAKDLGEKAKAAVENATKSEEPTMDEPVVDEPAANAPECPCDSQCGEPVPPCEPECPCEPQCDEPIRPVAPDVIYHADAPAAEDADNADDPENTING